ncbi:MAG: O-antigen ligase family protein [Leptospiraceae bacterium]|nr:O-antigen ligase family protein [Leptospiraceae bacterium]
MTKQKFFILFLQIGIATCGVSVSISQGFLFLALVVFLLDKRWRKIKRTPLFYAGISIFLFYILSILGNAILGTELALAKGFSKASELKDFLIFSAFIVMQGLDEEEEKKVLKAFYILIGILIVTGFISIFSITRLSVLISELYKTVTTYRLAHHHGNIFGIGIYLPIGLMNTHLTFGGLLLFFFPFLFFRVVGSFRRKGNYKERVFNALVLSIYMIVFLLNNARSAMIGAAIGSIFGLYDYLFVKEGIPLQRFKKAFLILGGFLLVSVTVLWNVDATKRNLQHLFGNEKHTDSGRSFIWNSTFPLIENNPVLGIGPGRYNIEIEKSRKELSIKNPETVYFYEVTQRGHAHNDYFHLFAIAGVGAPISYLALLFFIVSFISGKLKSKTYSPLFYGLIGFFISSTYQCYFQDDEVVIVFWYLVGFLNHLAMKEESLKLKET